MNLKYTIFNIFYYKTFYYIKFIYIYIMVQRKSVFTKTQKLILLYMAKMRKKDVNNNMIFMNVKGSRETVLRNTEKLVDNEYLKVTKIGGDNYYKLTNDGKLKLVRVHSKKIIKDIKIKKGKASLTKSQNIILSYLYYNEQKIIIIDDMVKHIKLSNASVGKHLQILMNKGYVKRYKSRGDKSRRLKVTRYIYHITDAGALVALKKKRMQKRFRIELADSFRKLASGRNEYSIAIDFERHLKSPERFVVVRGSRISTKTIKDFEMYGHTHPGETFPIPSAADLRNKREGEPTFIVAGNSPNNIIILEIKDLTQYKKWKKTARHLPRNSSATIKSDFIKKYGEATTYLIDNLTNKTGRDMYLGLTGVKITPYYEGMKIDLNDDVIREKKVPTVSEWDLNKWDEKGLL